MSSLQSTLQYYSGYLTGLRTTPLIPTSLTQLSTLFLSRATSLISLPLPFLSFLALPFFGGTATTVNLLFFYLIWSAFVLRHDPLTVEIVGTLLVRLVCFLLPALAMLAFDCGVPNIAKSLKARGEAALPLRLGRDRLLSIAAVATCNTLLAVALQAALEVLWTDIFHLRSILKTSTAVPLPWNIFTSLLKALALRGVLHYSIHRYLLHTHASPLKTWHKDWQHSIRHPFSLVAAYDQALPYLLANFLPTFLPAYLLRLHVLVWLLFLAITSLEDLFLYSGYAVLPSSIMLAGMARRTDAHFLSVTDGAQDEGNYGHMGVLDFVCRTTCKGQGDVASDLAKEVADHDIQDRVEKAVKAALAGAAKTGGAEDEGKGKSRRSGGKEENDAEYVPAEDEHDALQASARGRADEEEDAREGAAPRQRRSGRNRMTGVKT